jgi:NAD(P)-dependent dehydrogenase (short-subunit alcohol dehydrogenase family)
MVRQGGGAIVNTSSSEARRLRRAPGLRRTKHGVRLTKAAALSTCRRVSVNATPGNAPMLEGGNPRSARWIVGADRPARRTASQAMVWLLSDAASLSSATFAVAAARRHLIAVRVGR